MENFNEANIPGAAGVIRRFAGNEFYCTVHKKIINPVLVEVEGNDIAACEECAIEDLINDGSDVIDPVLEKEETALVKVEDIQWESMT